MAHTTWQRDRADLTTGHRGHRGLVNLRTRYDSRKSTLPYRLSTCESGVAQFRVLLYCNISISASTLFIARQARSDLLCCKCSHPLSHDRLVQIPLYFMLQYCSLGYQWARINNPAVLLVYSSGWPRPIVCYTSRNKRVVAKTWQRLWVFSRTSRVTAILKIICTSFQVVVHWVVDLASRVYLSATSSQPAQTICS